MVQRRTAASLRKFLDDAGYLDTDAGHVPTAIEHWYLRSLDEPSGLTLLLLVLRSVRGRDVTDSVCS